MMTSGSLVGKEDHLSKACNIKYICITYIVQLYNIFLYCMHAMDGIYIIQARILFSVSENFQPLSPVHAPDHMHMYSVRAAG